MQSLQLVTAPAENAVALADLKTFLRIEGTADDAMLTTFLIGAQKLLEKWTSRRFVTQTWAFFLDGFPGEYNFDALQEGTTQGKLSEYLHTKAFIEIPLMPLQAVDHLKTYDDSNVAYTMSSSDYFVDTSSEPGRLALTNNATWPATYLRPVKGIEIQFDVGYGAAADVPSDIKQAIMQVAAGFYENRMCSEVESAIPGSVRAILQSYRVYRI